MIRVKLIVAADEDDAIGHKDGRLPWPKLQADMERFRYVTSLHPVIMGRVTFEAIGEPLKNRISIVLTRSELFPTIYPSPLPANSIDEALNFAIQATYQLRVDSIWVIGGASVYEQLLPYTHEIYLTRVHSHTHAEVKMPQGWLSGCRAMGQGTHITQPGAPNYTFERYVRSP